jgi:acyl-CoA reductase-like NAD-dependent aldehyde dehydrogenase
MPKPFHEIRSAAIDGRVHNPFYRKSQLKKLHDALRRHGAEIQEAVAKDTGYRSIEIQAEYLLTLGCLKEAYSAINSDQTLRDEYRIANGEDASDAVEPVGVVIIEPATHAILFCLLSAVVQALAAGNCVIVKARISCTYIRQTALTIVI